MVTKELCIDKSNLNRYLRKMYSEAILDAKYKVNIDKMQNGKNCSQYVNELRAKRVLKDKNTITYYIIEDDDKNLSIEELEEAYGGFYDYFESI